MNFFQRNGKSRQNEDSKEVRIKISFWGRVSVDPKELVESKEYKKSVEQAMQIKELLEQ